MWTLLEVLCRSHANQPATQHQVSLPCPVDILALPASLFLGTGLPAPSSLAAPHSDSKTPLCLPRRGGLSQILPAALLGIPLQSEASSSYPANNGHRDCVYFLKPAWVHPACFILLPKKKRAGGRETGCRLSKFLWALAWLLACCQSSGLGASSTPRIWDSIPAPTPSTIFLPSKQRVLLIFITLLERTCQSSWVIKSKTISKHLESAYYVLDTVLSIS